VPARQHRRHDRREGLGLDTVVTAEAPEGIALALRPAGVVARSYAFALDMMIRAVILLIASIVLGTMNRLGGGLFLILLFGIEWLYPVLFELMPGAATPGKRAVGLKVVMDTGLPITPAASLVRNLLRAADFLPFLYAFGLLAMLLRPDFKRIGDLAAGTLVIHADTVRLHGALPEAAPRAPARALSVQEQAAIVAWAGRATRLTAARHDELAQLAATVTRGAKKESADALNASDQLLGVAQWIVGRR
jgi:uncharacterized RDD family membrane protein YckC